MFLHLSPTLKAMILAFLGYTAFAWSDASVKFLTERGYSIFQIITIDTTIGVLLLLCFAHKLGGLRSLYDPSNAKIHAARAFLNTVLNIMVVTAFSLMPLATAYTGIFTMPLMAALLAIPLYGQKIGPHRLAAILIGLSGILIAFRPWEAQANTAHLALLLSATFCIALMFVISRSLKGSSLLAVGFYPILGSCLLTAPLMALNYTPINFVDLPFFIVTGFLVTFGIIAVSTAFRMADSAAVGPMMYTEIIWAILFGALIFGDWPDGFMLMGAGIIILSGLYLVYRERRNLSQ